MEEKKDPNGYCPSCMKPQDRMALCERCAKRRDTGINHSEESIQNEIKKRL
jgi:predicted amidophosphoribosyltransferase